MSQFINTKSTSVVTVHLCCSGISAAVQKNAFFLESRPLNVGLIGCLEKSVITNVHCLTSQKN
jgi:hypothetical protein